MPYYQPIIIGVGLPGYQHHPYGYWGSGMPYHTGYHEGYNHWQHGYPYHHGWQHGFPYHHYGWQGHPY
jgi:hypothetical protein